jgi:hypothetical protein
MSAFDDATRVSLDGSCEVHDGWDIGGNANGGYLLALGASGLRALAGRPDPVSITAHFLAPGRPGPAQVEGAVVKEGKRFVCVSGSLRSGGRPVIQVLGTFGDLAASGAASGPGSDAGVTVVKSGPPELPPVEQCRARRSSDGGVPIPLMDRLRVHLHPDHAGFVDGRPSGDGVISGWFEFADDRPLDALALLLVADAFPPAVFELDVPAAWVPTVELTVHLRARPVPGALRCVFRTRFVHGGMLEEDGEVWDASDTLVAQSRQLALLPRT